MTKSRQSTVPLPKWRPRRTVIDLYNEKDTTPWYWRAAATVAAFFISIGFLVFPTAFNNASDLSVEGRPAGVAAAVLLALGYGLSAALWMVVNSWIFQLEVIFGPCLSSSLFGLFNIVYWLSTHNTPKGKSEWNIASVSALVLATLSSLVYAVLTLLTFRKIHIVRMRDSMHRYRSSDTVNLLPEDEMQRRQLLHLLSQKEAGKPSPAASQTTFKIDLPNELRRQASRLGVHRSVYDGSRDHGRSRSASEIPQLNHWGLANTTTAQHETHRDQHESMLVSRSSIPSQPPQIPTQIPLAQTSPFHTNATFPSSPQPYNTHHTRHRSDSTASSTDDLDARYPPEKPTLSQQHPLERDHPALSPRPPNILTTSHRRLSNRSQNEYRIVPAEEAEEIIRRNSRESRRTEIELQDRPSSRQELEGVEVSPRIKRVETDGWGRSIMGG